jgi:hypothetical protein
VNWLWEHPWVIAFVGLMTTALLVAGRMQTQRRAFLWGAVVSLVATGVLLALEQRIVTDREQVRATLYRIADDLERNDAQAVIAAMDPKAPQLAQEVNVLLKRAVVQSISIKSNLQIELDRGEPPRTAVATFNAVAVLEDRAGQYGRQRFPYFVTVYFRRRENHWKVEAYRLQDFREGLRSAVTDAPPIAAAWPDRTHTARREEALVTGCRWPG